MSELDNNEFEVLGYKVRFKSGKEAETNPKDVIDYVERIAMQVRDQAPSFDGGKLAVLVALKLASEKLNLETDYKENIQKLNLTAKDALNLIEDISANPQ